MLCCGGGTLREKELRHRDAVRHYHGDDNVSCGQWKDDDDLGNGCDPRSFPCTLRLVDVGIDGRMKAEDAACRACGIDPAEVNRTINQVLNLNCERLRVARQRLVREVAEEVVYLAIELAPRVGAQAQALLAVVAEGRLAPDAGGHLRAFWTVERQYLAPWSETWIAANAHRLGFR